MNTMGAKALSPFGRIRWSRDAYRFFSEIIDTASSRACWSNARRDKLNGDLGSTISLLLRVDLWNKLLLVIGLKGNSWDFKSNNVNDITQKLHMQSDYDAFIPCQMCFTQCTLTCGGNLNTIAERRKRFKTKAFALSPTTIGIWRKVSLFDGKLCPGHF